MGFTLSQSDVDKVQKSINITNALTISKKQGRSMGRPTRQYTYVKLSENVLDTGDPTLFWYGDEVGFDEDGAPVIKANGKAWSITTAPLLVHGAVGEINDVLRIEPSALSDDTLIWLALKSAGGGDTLTWIKTDADETDGTGTGTVYPFRGSVNPVQEGGMDLVVNWAAPDLVGKGTISAGNWFCCTFFGLLYYPINIPVAP